MIDGEFYDAGAYKAAPVPMALDTGTVYEAERTGNSLGLFTVSGALQGPNKTWLGAGTWLPAGSAPRKTAQKAESKPRGIDMDEENKPPVLHRRSEPESPKPAAPPPQPNPPAAPPPPATTPPAASAPAAAPVAPPPPPPTTAAPAPAAEDDSDRPVLRRGKPSPLPSDDFPAPAPAGPSSKASAPGPANSASGYGLDRRRPGHSGDFRCRWPRAPSLYLSDEAGRGGPVPQEDSGDGGG